MRIVVIILLISNTVWAGGGYTCEETLNACDKAYESQKVMITSQQEQIRNYREQSELQKILINDQSKKIQDQKDDTIKVAAVTAVVVLLLQGVLSR